MSFWSFLWIAMWREAGAMIRSIQIALVTVPAFGAVLVGIFGGEWSKDLWPAWAWLLIALGMASVSVFIGVTKRAYFLEGQMTPRLSINGPFEYHMPWRAARDGEKVSRHFYISIKNEFAGRIEGCSVTEHSFINNSGHTAPSQGRFFRLRSERQADAQLHEYERYFDLNGKGAEVSIDICSMDEGKPGSPIIMYYATKATDQQKDAIDQALFPHILTLAVRAKNLPIEMRAAFKIAVSKIGELTMRRIDNGARQIP